MKIIFDSLRNHNDILCKENYEVLLINVYITFNKKRRDDVQWEKENSNKISIIWIRLFDGCDSYTSY